MRGWQYVHNVEGHVLCTVWHNRSVSCFIAHMPGGRKVRLEDQAGRSGHNSCKRVRSNCAFKQPPLINCRPVEGAAHSFLHVHATQLCMQNNRRSLTFADRLREQLTVLRDRLERSQTEGMHVRGG